MKTVSQILIVLLLLIAANFSQETEILKNSEVTRPATTKDNSTTNEGLEIIHHVTTENSIRNMILELTTEVATAISVKSKEIEGSKLEITENKLFAKQEIVFNISNTTQNEEVDFQTILKDLTKHQEGNKDISEKSTESLNDTTNKQKETQDISEKFTENRINGTTTTTVNNLDANKDTSEKTAEALVVAAIKNNQEETKETLEKSTEYVISERSLVDVTTTKNNQEDTKDIAGKSTEYLVDKTTITSTTTTVDYERNTKPLENSLEDYAVKQMNFILDHLLMETQEFVAKVLQATVNTVFQRDYLKRYAEGLNRLLNPDSDSDEIIEDTKAMTQDELYEAIVLKLNFLKSKPSQYLQRHLPRDWINEYRNKRAELTIWLDKASEQMHREFNRFVTEEEDHIKYQYFSEAFDDISRATEIHHKLALLEDLVKIVKNKKQITFMDLYMQT